MIRGVPRTNPPAQAPFTYNPRPSASRMTPPESVANTSPVSPVANVIPGAGPIPPLFQARGLPNRSTSGPTGATTMPPTPGSSELRNVVPTQPVPQDMSEESDTDEYDFMVGDGSENLALNNLSPELIVDIPVVPGDDLDTMGNMPLVMGDFSQSDPFNPGNMTFSESVEEVISPEVIRGESSVLPLINVFPYPCLLESSALGFNTSYSNDFAPTTMSPAVVFGPMAPYINPEWANYPSAYQPNPEYTNWQGQTNGYGFNDMPAQYQEQVPFTPQILRTPTLGLDQDRLRNMLILYYFKHVRQMQYVFAGDVTTNVMMHHAQMDPQGVVSLALCSLAALHDSRMRIANGIMPNDQRARGPADKYYQKALHQLQGNKHRNGRLTDADATAALHFVSFW